VAKACQRPVSLWLRILFKIQALDAFFEWFMDAPNPELRFENATRL
jgi:hypothetical protein